jgi:uncharacterized protein
MMTADVTKVDWMLDDLIGRVPSARHAVVLTVDGILTGRSGDLAHPDAEHVAAVAAGFSGLARAAGRHFRGGPVRQTIVEMEDGYLFVVSAAQGACLAVLSDVHSDLGLIAYEMALLIERIGHAFEAAARFSGAAAEMSLKRPRFDAASF